MLIELLWDQTCKDKLFHYSCHRHQLLGGMEHLAARDSGVVMLAKNSGTIKKVDSKEVVIKRDSDGGLDVYKLLKFKRSNQGTCINQRPIVSKNEHVDKGRAYC